MGDGAVAPPGKIFNLLYHHQAKFYLLFKPDSSIGDTETSSVVWSKENNEVRGGEYTTEEVDTKTNAILMDYLNIKGEGVVKYILGKNMHILEGYLATKCQ